MIKHFTGDRIGKLVLVEKIRVTHKHYKWICLCDCGVTVQRRSEHLFDGKSVNLKSCGCTRREQLSMAVRKKHGSAAQRSLFCQYRSSAKKRKMRFELTMDQFMVITQEDCSYCGTSPSYTHRGHRDCGDYKYTGIDRVDNKKGYIEGNCVPACRLCNQAKHDRSLDEFTDWLKRIGKKYD